MTCSDAQSAPYRVACNVDSIKWEFLWFFSNPAKMFFTKEMSPLTMTYFLFWCPFTITYWTF